MSWCNSLSCPPPPGQLAPRGARSPALGSLPPTPENLATQFKMILFIFITNLYHTIIRTVVMYVFHCFSLYERRLVLRYCSLSIFLPNSEVLADTVQKDILSLSIEFPVEQVIRESPVFDITYLFSNRKGRGRGGKIPWPGQLASHPWKLGKFRSEKLFNHFKLKLLMHRY